MGIFDKSEIIVRNPVCEDENFSKVAFIKSLLANKHRQFNILAKDRRLLLYEIDRQHREIADEVQRLKETYPKKKQMAKKIESLIKVRTLDENISSLIRISDRMTFRIKEKRDEMEEIKRQEGGVRSVSFIERQKKSQFEKDLKNIIVSLDSVESRKLTAEFLKMHYKEIVSELHSNMDQMKYNCDAGQIFLEKHTISLGLSEKELHKLQDEMKVLTGWFKQEIINSIEIGRMLAKVEFKLPPPIKVSTIGMVTKLRKLETRDWKLSSFSSQPQLKKFTRSDKSLLDNLQSYIKMVQSKVAYETQVNILREEMNLAKEGQYKGLVSCHNVSNIVLAKMDKLFELSHTERTIMEKKLQRLIKIRNHIWYFFIYSQSIMKRLTQSISKRESATSFIPSKNKAAVENLYSMDRLILNFKECSRNFRLMVETLTPSNND
ncbi:hypothetical protein SNEBB_005177 [Seison nebaliae]|nr:hypothetical protein SNEBB_005177 [Seison nebaliae]